MKLLPDTLAFSARFSKENPDLLNSPTDGVATDVVFLKHHMLHKRNVLQAWIEVLGYPESGWLVFPVISQCRVSQAGKPNCIQV